MFLHFSGTGNVLKVQSLLHICSEHFEKDKDEKEKDSKSKDKDKKDKKEESSSDLDGSHQGIAVLGIAAIAMGEDIGTEMSMRSFSHLVSFCSHLVYCLLSFSYETL